LAEELLEILKAGLPVRYEMAGVELLRIVGFKGNKEDVAVDGVLPYVVKIDKLIREQLDTFGGANVEWGNVAKILFGHSPGSGGLRIGKRYNLAAEYKGGSERRIRNNLKKICADLALQIYIASAKEAT
jgi:hypothetical protein